MHQNRIQRGIRATLLVLSFLSLAGTAIAQDDDSWEHHSHDDGLAPVLASNQYQQKNLVSDLPGAAAITDPNLVNPWGISRSSGSPWWVSDNGAGRSTLYDGQGNIQPLVVAIPPSDPNAGPSGTPTGTVFNGSKDFAIVPGKPAIFLFVSEDGVISGWNPGINLAQAQLVVNQKDKSVFKGAAIATVNLHDAGTHSYLYVADFRQGHLAIFDTNFKRVHALEDAFSDHRVPEGYAPFNVQNIGGNLYVAYAKQDSAKHDEVDGAGLGFVHILTPSGRLIGHLQHGPWFNAPWGVTLASSDFGPFSHDILVGNFGSGQIAAFDPVTGRFKDFLRDAKSAPIAIDGLWGIGFGNGATAGSATSLYFAAGTNHEQDGLFGSLTALQNPQGNGQ